MSTERAPYGSGVLITGGRSVPQPFAPMFDEFSTRVPVEHDGS